MATEPTKYEVDAALMDLASRELDRKPVGSIVMFSQCCGFQKMSFWWNVRVYGFWKTIRRVLNRKANG